MDLRRFGVALALLIALSLAAWALTDPNFGVGPDPRADLSLKPIHPDFPITIETDENGSRLVGFARSEREKRQLLDSAREIYGSRAPDDGIQVLETLQSYPFLARRNPGERIVISGAAPSPIAKVRLEKSIATKLGETAAVDIVIANGAPKDWLDQVVAALDVLAELDHGEVAVQSADVRLRGGSKSEKKIAAARLAAGLASQRFSASSPWSVDLSLDKPVIAVFSIFAAAPSAETEGKAVLKGFAPDAVARSKIIAALADATNADVDSEVVLADSAPNDERGHESSYESSHESNDEWVVSVIKAIPTVTFMDGGSIRVTGNEIFLSGTPETPEELEAVKAQLVGLGVTLDSAIKPKEPRWASTLSIEKTGDGLLTLAGRVPTGLSAAHAAALLAASTAVDLVAVDLAAVDLAAVDLAAVDLAAVVEGGRGDVDLWHRDLAAFGVALRLLDTASVTYNAHGLRFVGVSAQEGAADQASAYLARVNGDWRPDLAFAPPFYAAFPITISLTESGSVRIEGAAPSVDDRSRIMAGIKELAGENGVDGVLTLGRGASAGWADKVLALLPALQASGVGVLTFRGDEAVLSATPETPEAAEALLAVLSPFRNQLTVALTPKDSRRAATLSIEKTRESEFLTDGRLPQDLDNADAAQLAGIDALAALPSDGRGNAGIWRQDLAFLALANRTLLAFKAEIGAERRRLEGVSSDESASMRLQSAAPAHWTLSVAFEPPVLSPFLIKITKSPDGGITAVGAAPTNFDRDKIFAALQGMAGDAPLAVELMLAVGAPEGWTARVMQQVASIAVLREGVLTIKDDAVLMSGVAESAVAGGIQVDLPDVPGVAADTAPVLAEVARLEARDPSRLDVSIDASKGVMIQGLLPVGIEPAEARALLGVQTVTGRLETGGGGDPALWRAELAALGELLPEFENLDASLDTGVAKVSGEILPKSDVGQVEHLLQEGLANRSAAVDVSVSEQRFEAGDKRVNPVTNRPEIYKNGFWLPIVTLDGTEACHKASDLVLFTNKIRFLFDSAVLDVRARKVINALSSIALDCLKAADRGLAGAEIGGLEIGGHADSTGPAGYNRQLSGIRARAVRAALVERGAPATLLKVVAYGESTPIASNATTAGRAANRRISFDWLP